MFFPEDVCMTLRALLLAAVVFLGPGSVQAQQPSELIGEYHLTVTSRAGTDCTDDSELDVNVKSIQGNVLEFGARDEEEAAEFDPASMRFRFVQPSHGANDGAQDVVTGQFQREPDAVRLNVKVEVENCTVELTGSRPAPHLTATPPPLTAAPPAPAQAAPPADAKGMGGLIFWAPLAVLLVVAGAAAGFLLGRKKSGRDDTGDRDA